MYTAKSTKMAAVYINYYHNINMQKNKNIKRTFAGHDYNS